jgi:octaprenyl-diphosphate synthase
MKPISPSAAERFSHSLALIPELKAVESVIRSTFRSDVTPMREIPDYLLSLGGKRIRPALTLLCARALGSAHISQELIDIAAGIELIHMATLMHDDIIDESPIRRHKPSPYATYGVPLTLLSGDFLLTRAFGLCAKLDDHVIQATEQACIELVEGEALETPLHLQSHTIETSITIAERKTASLFRLAAFCAAHLSGASSEVIEAMSSFGQSLGVAFQMIDDILDVISDEATLGKRPGLDIEERKPSIVNLLWLKTGDIESKRLLTPPGETSEEQYVRQSLEMLKNGAVISEAKALAKLYAERAKTSLETAVRGTPNSSPEFIAALFTIIEFALERLR